MSSDEQAIRDLIAAWMRESKAGNVDAVLPLMAEDVVFLRPGCPAMRSRAAFAEASKGFDPNIQMEMNSDIREIVVDGNFASCWSQLSLTVTMPGKPPIKRSGPILTVFRKNPAGRWELFRDANMLTVES